MTIINPQFDGVKAALIYRDELLVYLRDEKPGLRFSGMWDFFGGGREGDETIFECIRRELLEELRIEISEEQIIFKKLFPAMHDPTLNAYFVVVNLTDNDIEHIDFGEEGQEYKRISLDEFMNSDDFVPFLKPRFQSYLQTKKTS